MHQLAEEAARADEDRRQQQLIAQKKRAEGRAIARLNRAAMREQQRRLEEEQALEMRLLDAVLGQHAQERADHREKKVGGGKQAPTAYQCKHSILYLSLLGVPRPGGARCREGRGGGSL